MEITGLPQKAYEAYGDFRGWKSHDDKPMPQWEELPLPTQNAWDIAIAAVFLAIREELRLEGRDVKTIRGSKVYRKDFSDAGFPGHNLLLLVAKLSDALRIE